MASANIATFPTYFLTHWWRARPETFGENFKPEHGTLHYFSFFVVVQHSLTYLLKRHAVYRNFFFRYLFDQILLCRFKPVRRTSTLYWMAFHIDTKNPPAWYKHLFTLSRRVAQQPSIRYGNDPVSWSVRRSLVMFNTETAPRPPFFGCVNRSAMRYGFRASVRSIWYRVDKA